jgi:hypothetical protein
VQVTDYGMTHAVKAIVQLSQHTVAVEQ